MKLHIRQRHINTALLCSAFFLSCLTACVNSIDSEPVVEEGDIPIHFSVKIEKTTTTKVTNNFFDKGDQLGLYAVLSGKSMEEERYIDNLLLKSDGNETLQPEKDVFYPEGEDAALDFVGYYPYQEKGITSKTAKLPIVIQADQSLKDNYSKSDFLIAKAKGITSDEDCVELKFKHKLANIKLTLTPGEGENIDDMLAANPRIVATGFYTQAEYDFQTDKVTPVGEPGDIIAYGKWEKEEGKQKLTGKELIIIPQAIGKDQTLQMEWNGKIYTCAMPPADDTQENTQYEINIDATQNTNNQLSGIMVSIDDWDFPAIQKGTDNSSQYASIHLSTLSFDPSNVYRVYSTRGEVLAEICKEYLLSKNLASQAIVSYPIKGGKADLSQGTILQLLDINDNINGGTIRWNTRDNTFNYEAGYSPRIREIYYDERGNVLTEKPGTPLYINVAAYTLRDDRDRGDTQEYPVVKIGTQYWMRSNLQATMYRDGTPIPRQETQGKATGYFTEDEEEYFYNGYVLEENELAPYGWRIPSEEDWQTLCEYVGDDASRLKTGVWDDVYYTKDGEKIIEEALPNNNLSMLGIQPLGIWIGKKVASIGTACGFWTWNDTGIPEETVFFQSQNHEIHWMSVNSSAGDYYKALSVRCIQEE